MAAVQISHQWNNEELTIIAIEFEDSYPDAMQRACDEGVRAFTEIAAIFTATLPAVEE